MMSNPLPFRLLPLTYDECRAQFRHAATAVATEIVAHPLEVRGPQGQELSIDVVALGSTAPARVLIILSGVHGVEGFIGSALQTDLLTRWEPAQWPLDIAVVVVHAVNPWGMAWSRRQNESNVDLNRNWRRDDGTPFHNDAYNILHPLACPDTDALPSVETLLATTAAMVEERGLVWVRDGITVGQYQHPDGLHYGGARTEESNRILEHVLGDAMRGATRVLTIDIHTGHGPWGVATALSDQPPGSAQDKFFRKIFHRVEATADNPDATTAVKAGQIANGIRSLNPTAECYSTALEIGTADDLSQLQATYQEQWVHRRGDRSDPAHQAAVWAYRCCFTPDDRQWERAAFATGREHLNRALAGLMSWT